MGGNYSNRDLLNFEEHMCSVCGRNFSGHGIRSLGGQIACSEECAERLRPLYPKFTFNFFYRFINISDKNYTNHQKNS